MFISSVLTVYRVFRNLRADALPVDSLNLELVDIHPILVIASAQLLVEGISVNFAPKGVSPYCLDVACGEGVVEGGGEDDDYKIFVGVVVLEVETLEVAVAPFEVVPHGLGTFLEEPELMLGAQLQADCGPQQQDEDENWQHIIVIVEVATIEWQMSISNMKWIGSACEVVLVFQL
jgi:hypothetical protein